MKLRKKILIASLSAICLLSFASSALACACCADRGTYDVWTTSVDSFYESMLGEMTFGTSSELFMTEAGFEGIRGLDVLAKEFEETREDPINLADVYTKRTWTLKFTSAGGKSGTLTLPRPARMTIRRIYIPDNESDSPNVWLYKELVFDGSVQSGSGFFRSSVARPAKYTLIFQGQGNNCDSSDQFKNWRLKVKGQRADYVFFGKMKAAGSTE